MEGASIPCRFGHHGGAYSVFWHNMMVWTSQQQWNRFWWPPMWFWATRAVFKCACVYEFRNVRIRCARRFYFVGALQFRHNVQTHLGVFLLGRALLIGILRYFTRVFKIYAFECYKIHIHMWMSTRSLFSCLHVYFCTDMAYVFFPVSPKDVYLKSYIWLWQISGLISALDISAVVAPFWKIILLQCWID